MLGSREEILTESVQGSEFSGEINSIDKTFSHEHVLANKLKIRHDHSNGSEKSLKSFRELSTPNVTGVHGNVGTVGGV
jgi:hypothetical protein